MNNKGLLILVAGNLMEEQHVNHVGNKPTRPNTKTVKRKQKVT